VGNPKITVHFKAMPRIFFSKVCQQTVNPSQPLIQRVLGTVSPEYSNRAFSWTFNCINYRGYECVELYLSFTKYLHCVRSDSFIFRFV